MSSDGATGTLYVVSAPSGAGKTSLVHAVADPDPALRVSVSHTTRRPRPGEREGTHYHFVYEDEFSAMIERGAFLEHARVFGHRYGTSRDWVLSQLAGDVDVVLEIDWQGARQVRAQMPESTGVFVLPPSRAELERRLRARGGDAEEVVARRMRAAVDELSHHDEFDYLVVNDDFGRAVEALRSIVAAGRLARARQLARHRELVRTLTG